MTKVIMHGCNGKMGQTITAMCKDDPEDSDPFQDGTVLKEAFDRLNKYVVG